MTHHVRHGRMAMRPYRYLSSITLGLAIVVGADLVPARGAPCAPQNSHNHWPIAIANLIHQNIRYTYEDFYIEYVYFELNQESAALSH